MISPGKQMVPHMMEVKSIHYQNSQNMREFKMLSETPSAPGKFDWPGKQFQRPGREKYSPQNAQKNAQGDQLSIFLRENEHHA